MIKDLFRIKNIALALGSGSAKGVAHIGVIEALEEEGCNITAISGTSMGGIVAAYYALGKLDVLKEWLLGMNRRGTFRTIDFSLTGGFISGKRLISYFQDHLGSPTFKEARIPLFIPATNLDTGEEEIFSSGPIIPAIRASISVPGVLKPYYYNGHYYVDGAVCDPVPVDVLRRYGCKNIIAVHMNRYVDPPLQNSKPSVVYTMMRSMSLVSKFLADAKMKRIKAVIEPELGDYGMFDIYKSKEIIDIGKHETKKIISRGALKNDIKNLAYNVFH